MQFKDVIGQHVAKQKMMAAAKAEKVPHALMFLGPEGNGNLPLALAFAQYLTCDNKQNTDSCGVCPSCTKNTKLVHPDIHFTFPVVPKKSGEAPISSDYITEWRAAITANPYININEWLQAIEAENRQGNITVRECHEIIRASNLKTYESTYKIHIIWLAEFLKEAGNTLLKIIEEPPANTIFLILVENQDLVLTTIMSRTQLIRVNAIEDQDIQQALEQRFDMDEQQARRIARISDGNYNAALAQVEGSDTINDKLLHRWLVCCFNLKTKRSPANVSALIDWVDEISKLGRENQKLFIKYGLFFLRECTLLHYTQASEKLADEELQFAKGLSSKLEADQLRTLSAIFSQMHYHIERNANAKVLFLSHSFRISSVFKQEAVLL